MRWLIAALVILCATNSWAQNRTQPTQQQTFSQYVNSLPAASALTGTEETFVLQGGTARQATTSQFSTNSANQAVNQILTTQDQTLSGGANVTSNNIGTVSSGTTTIDCGKSPLQYYTNGGAHTLAAPTHDGSCIILTANNASAGTITFSGFSVGSNTGDALDTTNTHKFSISIWRINGTAGYTVSAHQ